jgi:hypothetical protein
VKCALDQATSPSRIVVQTNSGDVVVPDLDAERQSESTVDGAAEAIYRFEAFNRFRDFKAFHIEQELDPLQAVDMGRDGSRVVSRSAVEG